MSNAGLHWLPECEAFRQSLAELADTGPGFWASAMALANHRLDFIQTGALDHVVRTHLLDGTPVADAARSMRLACLGSSTNKHLLPGIRVGALRRSLFIETYETGYGLFRQELLNADSGLHLFKPEVVLFAFDASYITAGLHAALTAPEVDALLEARLADTAFLWVRAQSQLNAAVIQQTVLPRLPDVLGNNEHRLSRSAAGFCDRFNAALQTRADLAGVHLLAVDRRARREGLNLWHDAALWLRSKQEISLHVAPHYGDLVGRLLAAIVGRSAKCLVLDLDNTLWGGVVGDDGIDGLVLGQGNALGEAFAEVQRYAAALADRGVILAVCSKNDPDVALAAFERHPEMVLRRNQIACFKANWDDKATNLRRIAAELNIGVDALVFLDDNPFERAQVRRELPMVLVPEVSPDPARVPQCLADAGYFEGIAITAEDQERTGRYQAEQQRQTLESLASDMPSYLRSLQMRLRWSRFSEMNLTRIVQLINKTNQFNLTGARLNENEVRALMAREDVVGIDLRLTDRFGDSGIIAIVIGELRGSEFHITTWLMSCRVLGRDVEQATLEIIIGIAKVAGATSISGFYVPSGRNRMVERHYDRLQFETMTRGPDECSTYRLVLADRDAPVNVFQLSEVLP